MYKKEQSSTFDQWIFSSFEVSCEGLGLFRIFVSLFLLFFLIPGEGFEHYRFVSELPSDFLSPPPGLLMLLDNFPSYLFFLFVHSIVVISLIAMLFGYRTHSVSVIAGVSLLILQGLLYSIGKINHEIVVPLVPFVMAFSNWGACFSVDAILKKNQNNQVYSWPLTLLALFIAFMMLTAGLPKILGGWLDLSTQAVKGHILNQFFIKGRDALLAPFAVQIHSPILWEAADWVTIFFETGFIVAVTKARWFKIFLIFAVLFHFSTQMMMNISFLPNFLAYSAFLNWGKIYHCNRALFKHLAAKGNGRLNINPTTGFGSILLVLFLILKWVSLKDIYFPNSDLMFHEFILVTLAVLVVLYFSVRYLRRAGKNRRREVYR